MKKILFCVFGLLFACVDVFAADIVATPNGRGAWDIFIDGKLNGSVSSEKALDKALETYRKQGNVVNKYNTPLVGAGNVKGGTAPSAATKLPATVPNGGTGANLPATVPNGGTGANLPATTKNGGTVAPQPVTSTTPKVNVGGAVLGGIGMATSGWAYYDDVIKSKGDAMTTVGDVVHGGVDGIGFAASTAAVVNAIPAFGQVAYGAAMVVGGVVGAAGAGLKMYSESDCDYNDILKAHFCCNIAISNNGKYRMGIGGEMPCADSGKGIYGVRQCIQYGRASKNVYTEDQGVKGTLLYDDRWSATCKPKFCNGYEAPAKGTKVQWYVEQYGAKNDKFCWKWSCADGKVRKGNTCIAAVGQDCKRANGTVLGFGKYVTEPCASDKMQNGKTCYYQCNAKKSDNKSFVVITYKDCTSGYSPTGKVSLDYVVDTIGYPRCAKGQTKFTCSEQRSTAEGKACCLLPAKVATWDGMHCNCTDGSKFDFSNPSKPSCGGNDGEADKKAACDRLKKKGEKVVWDSAIGECKCTEKGAVLDDPDVTLATKCLISDLEQEECDSKVAAGFRCEDSGIKAELERYVMMCKKGEGISTDELIDKVKELQEKCDSLEIESLVTKIDSIYNEFAGDISVWKDAEGNFNTARLVSDSVAGVVLGTAGAVITSKIVKKNQIEQGFEDLKCVVGGQEVAGWGDEFNVGLSTY